MSCLSDALHLTRDRFELKHRIDATAETELEFLRYPPSDDTNSQVGLTKHTDIGSLSILFSEQWGLQILSQDNARWESIEPRPGYAVVNIGDTLHYLSDNRLRSAVHRVVPVAGLAEKVRYTVGYFLRAEGDATLKSSDGALISARDYYKRKMGVYTLSHKEQEESKIIIGGMDG